MAVRALTVLVMSAIGVVMFFLYIDKKDADMNEADLSMDHTTHEHAKALPPKLEVVPDTPMVITEKNERLREEYFKLMKGLEITYLNLSGSHFDPDWLKYVERSSLKYLDLSGTLVEDKHKALLQSFTNLKSLKLNNTSLTEECLNQLAIR